MQKIANTLQMDRFFPPTDIMASAHSPDNQQVAGSDKDKRKGDQFHRRLSYNIWKSLEIFPS